MSHDPGHRYEWNTIPWRKLEVRVFKLQRRIYQATTRGETQKARRLQKLLAASWSAKSLAVRRVTQENTGKKTAGVDGVQSLTPPQRLKLISAMDLHAPAKPVRRIWIPKPGKLEKRPLASRSCMIGQRRRWSNWPSNQNGKRGLNPTASDSDPDAHAKTPSNKYSMSSANNPDMCLTQISPAASILHVDASFKNP